MDHPEHPDRPGTATPAASFADLALPAPVLRTLDEHGVREPFPIQAATLPDALAGRDVLGRGRTGSGKTLAFGLPLLVRTAGQRAEAKQPLALILVPTRELAQQVGEALAPYAEALGLRMAAVVGGMSIGRQIAALRDGAEVVVATPAGCTTSSSARPAAWGGCGSPSSTRPTRCATWASCPRSRRSSTRCGPRASGCCSRPPWTAMSTTW